MRSKLNRLGLTPKKYFFQDDGSRGSAAVVPEMVSRSSSSHEVLSSMIRSPEMGPSGSGSSGTDQQQQQVPLGAVAIVS